VSGIAVAYDSNQAIGRCASSEYDAEKRIVMVISNYLFGILTATAFATQAAPAQPVSPPKVNTPVMTLSGCVSPDAATPGSYTLADSKTGAIYRLSGFAAPKDAKRGETAVGSGAFRVSIRGGLVPSANVAAQAGAIDASKAAIASAPGGTGSGTGNVQLPEFRATHVQTLKGSCP
jgi:hypothetical protein